MVIPAERHSPAWKLLSLSREVNGLCAAALRNLSGCSLTAVSVPGLSLPAVRVQGSGCLTAHRVPGSWTHKHRFMALLQALGAGKQLARPRRSFDSSWAVDESEGQCWLQPWDLSSAPQGQGLGWCLMSPGGRSAPGTKSILAGKGILQP